MCAIRFLIGRSVVVVAAMLPFCGAGEIDVDVDVDVADQLLGEDTI